MKIINVTKNTTLAERVIVADTLLSRMRGLLGRKSLEKGEALILKSCNSIHTFFMRFTIDVIFADRNMCVVKTISYLKPFRASLLYRKAFFAVELPAGTILESATSAGDFLILER
ncbi:MAG: DUF192 domain-containing protein [Candidatus Omnitrophica bacterium]|nr:DUF192 domain-containing protein [Candidatus Omnitrophota bacterium]